MSVKIEVITRSNDQKGGVIGASFKAFKSSVNGNYKTYGDCTFSVDHDNKLFIPIQDVTDSQVTDWIKAELGLKRLKAIETILSTRIKNETKPAAKKEQKE
tara:strand:- start:624 stop:926 length:303 start_codon:yes stop_codon:yes gene_type:complete